MSEEEKNDHFGARVVEALELENFAMDFTNLEDLVQMLLARCKERLTFEVLNCCPHGFDDSERFSVIYMDGVPVAAEYYNLRWDDTPNIKPTYYVGPNTSRKRGKSTPCDMVFIEESIRHSIPHIQAQIDGNGRCANSEAEGFFTLTNLARYDGELVWDKMSNAAANTVCREARTVYRKRLNMAPTKHRAFGKASRTLINLSDEWINLSEVK